jgi:2-isopropylmalate synthase
VKIVPEVEKAMDYLRAIYALGVRYTLVGLYAGRGTITDQRVQKILGQLKDEMPEMTPVVGAPTMVEAVEWGKECKAVNEKTGMAIFRGTAPLRMFAEGWTVEQIKNDIKKSFSLAAKYKIELHGTIEHATQTPPWFIREIIETMVQASGEYLKALIITDTAGVAGARGIARLFKFVQKVAADMGREDIMIKIHNHNDRGLAASNALVAMANGATMVGLAPWGDGERAGNCSLESVVANLYYILRGGKERIPFNPQKLWTVSEAYGNMIGETVPEMGVLAGNAFSSCFGTHLAAEYKIAQLIKELDETKQTLSIMKDAIHSPWGTAEWGRKPKIVVSAATGLKGIKLKAWYDLSMDLTDEQAQKVYDVACKKAVPLTNKEFEVLVLPPEQD